MVRTAQGGGGVTNPGGDKKCADVALGDVIGGHEGDGFGLDLEILVVFSNLNGSMIPRLFE